MLLSPSYTYMYVVHSLFVHVRREIYSLTFLHNLWSNVYSKTLPFYLHGDTHTVRYMYVYIHAQQHTFCTTGDFLSSQWCISWLGWISGFSLVTLQYRCMHGGRSICQYHYIHVRVLVFTICNPNTRNLPEIRHWLLKQHVR